LSAFGAFATAHETEMVLNLSAGNVGPRAAVYGGSAEARRDAKTIAIDPN